MDMPADPCTAVHGTDLAQMFMIIAASGLAAMMPMRRNRHNKHPGKQNTSQSQSHCLFQIHTKQSLLNTPCLWQLCLARRHTAPNNSLPYLALFYPPAGCCVKKIPQINRLQKIFPFCMKLLYDEISYFSVEGHTLITKTAKSTPKAKDRTSSWPTKNWSGKFITETKRH